MKVISFLFIAVFMLVAKPFIGFASIKRIAAINQHSILVKSFTKRKQEYVKDGMFDIKSVHDRLADPLSQILLFSFLLTILFPAIINAGKLITNGLLSQISLSLFPPGQLYLLFGIQLI